MNKRILSIFALSLLIAFTGCEKEVTNIKLPQASSKLVVTSFISPQDTLLRVSVVESVPAIGKSTLSSNTIRDATVTMSNGDRSVTFTYQDTQQAYVADADVLPIVQGNSYALEVVDTKGRKANATCTVPINQPVDVEMVIDSAKSDYADFMQYYMTLNWQDTPGEINYYRIFAEIATTQGSHSPFSQRVYFEDSRNDINLLTDNRLDGAKFSSPRGSIWKPPYNPDHPTTNTLVGYLLNTDEHYYRYHQSLNNNYNTDGNPFAEPVLLYSNMNGGLGVFASYNRNTVSMPIK
jgi:hypothetical protein